MITTSHSGYGTECTVVRSTKDPDLFYLNLQVFEVKRSPEGIGVSGERVSSIWCAVYHVSPGETGVRGESGPVGR